MGYMAQAAEWQKIKDELIADWEAVGRPFGKEPTAYQVTLEQRKRCLARGEHFMDYEDIMEEYYKSGGKFTPES